MIPPYIFSRPFRDDQPFRRSTKRQTSDLSKISDWCRENLVMFNASKT
ncbi:hypothetical protein E2C01_075775 [Portunus trituberculatus]|uniref:Uncharacterized protein n=1 Tax=Portunus trituberculatus TaxID=210409 RepID=A0A5B7IH66_PORTR|nr:hypothetical protein [Portunus trituberculatus]